VRIDGELMEIWPNEVCDTLPASVIIDREPEYEISKIVDSKIDHWRACKLLYKVIWLGYKDTNNDSE